MRATLAREETPSRLENDIAHTPRRLRHGLHRFIGGARGTTLTRQESLTVLIHVELGDDALGRVNTDLDLRACIRQKKLARQSRALSRSHVALTPFDAAALLDHPYGRARSPSDAHERPQITRFAFSLIPLHSRAFTIDLTSSNPSLARRSNNVPFTLSRVMLAM